MEQQQKHKPEDYTQPTRTENVKINEVTEKDHFLIIDREGEFLIALGNKIISHEKFETREAAEAYIESKPWELIFNATAVMFENLQKYRQQLENEQ